MRIIYEQNKNYNNNKLDNVSRFNTTYIKYTFVFI